MTRFRLVVAMYLTCIALVFPLSAHAWPGEGVWNDVKRGFVDQYNDVKEDLHDILDFTEAVLEVGWEGIYGAGCGIKNLKEWDGTSCRTSVAASGDNFRSLIRDVDDCLANADPTTLIGMAAEETTSVEDTGLGLLPSEVEALAGMAGQAEALSPAMQQYLKSPRAQEIIANLPGWQKVSRKVPLLKYAAGIASFTATCGSTIDFLDYGLKFGLGEGPTIVKRDGVWMECQWKCVPKLELNTADCNAQATTPHRHEELQGRYLGNGYEPGEVRCTGPTRVETTGPTGPGGGPGSAPLDPRSVPGGSTSGTCAALIRGVASSGSTGGFSRPMVSACLGTTDTACHVVRAKAAAGHAVFPLTDQTLQQRCFG